MLDLFEPQLKSLKRDLSLIISGKQSRCQINNLAAPILLKEIEELENENEELKQKLKQINELSK